MKTVCIIGQFAPPIHGLSKALDTLINSNIKYKYKLYTINLTKNSLFLRNWIKVINSNWDIYYLTIAQSKGGNIRDLILVATLLLKKKKVILHLHGGGYRYNLENDFLKIQKILNYKIFSKVSAGIVLGKSLKYNFENIISDNKIYIVENCADEEYIIDDIAFYNKLNQLDKKEKIQVIYLSNFIVEKGYREVLELARFIKENCSNKFTFKFAGKFFSKEEEEFFFKFIDENELSNFVQYNGVISGDEKYKLLAESDVFILLTEYRNEGQPISIIEAAFNGQLIVTTNHAGICDIVNNETALIYEGREISIEKIYFDILNSMNNKNELKQRLNKNRIKMKENFSKDEYILKIDKIFREL